MKTLADIKKMTMTSVGPPAVDLSDQEVLDAINLAILNVREEMPYHVSPDDTSVTLASDTYEYSLSSVSMNSIYGIIMADSDGDFPIENVIAHWLWMVITGPTLKLDELRWSPTAGRKLRIEGQAFQDTLSSDTDTLHISDAYVVAKAAATLLGGLGSPRETTMLAIAEDARDRSSFRYMPSSRLVRS